MAVFITHCSKSISRFVVLMAGLAVALMLTALPAQADSIEVRDARLEAQEDSWILYTEFGLDLSSRLEEAINKGVPLYFNPEHPNARPRAEYHPGESWLRDNGRDPAMAKCVEFSNVSGFTMKFWFQFRTDHQATTTNFAE